MVTSNRQQNQTFHVELQLHSSDVSESMPF